MLEFQYYARANATNYNDIPDWWLDNDTVDNDTVGNDDFVDPLRNAINIGKQIYKYLKVEAKQIYTKAFNIEFKNKNQVSGEPDRYHFLCVNRERFNPINFGINYHKDRYDGFACFWYKDSKWTFSLYNDNGNVDCSLIAKEFGGGGHKGAAGFVIDDINKILK